MPTLRKGRGKRLYTEEQYDRALELLVLWKGQQLKFRAEGLPHGEQLWVRSRKDADFRAKYEAALAKAGRPPAKHRRFVEADFNRLLEAIRVSECRSKAQFWNGIPPDLPGVSSAFQRARRNPEFAKKFEAALSARWYPTGDSFYRTEAGRKFQGEKYKRRLVYGPEVIAELLRAVAAGDRVARVCRRDGMPRRQSLDKRMKASPELRARVLEAMKAGQLVRVKKKLAAAKLKYQEGLLRLSLLQDDLYRAAERVVPQYCADRDDIMSDLVEAVLVGDFDVSEMTDRLSEVRAEHRRRLGTFRTLSLDRKIGDSEVAYVDRLSSDDYSYVG